MITLVALIANKIFFSEGSANHGLIFPFQLAIHLRSLAKLHHAPDRTSHFHSTVTLLTLSRSHELSLSDTRFICFRGKKQLFATTMPVRISWPAVGAMIHPNIGAIAGGFITRKNINPWYESLKKPSWTPPNWVFGPIWSSIYTSMGYASYLVWRDGGGFEGAALPLSFYGLNLALNWTWTPLFFGAHNIKLALYDIVVLWGTTAAMGIAFHRVNPVAGYLIAPYVAWNTLAVALNYVIYRDNPTTVQPSIEEKKK